MTGELNGKIALVTGGSRGIGRAIATTLARRGARFVGVHYGSDDDAAHEVVHEIRALGAQAAALKANFAGGKSAVDDLWRQFHDAAGGPDLDILVNNAGVSPPLGVTDTSEADFDRVIGINFKAPFFLVQAAAPHLRQGGRIINISTLGTRVSSAPYAAYVASKGALETLTLALASEFGARGISVNAVAPGFTDTEMNAEWLADPQARAGAEGSSVFGRLGQAQDIADVVAFLASEEARWMTGQVIDATGGARL